MFRNIGHRIQQTLSFIVPGILCAGLLAAGPALASDTGVLKLKVQRCFGSNWIGNAQVSVSIVRPGAGEVDSDSGTTDSIGYAEFTFNDLEDGDEAHVTITPGGDTPDASHVYYWTEDESRSEMDFDLGPVYDAICQDGWYEEKDRIFLCLYH